jgi:hypothetical protein
VPCDGGGGCSRTETAAGANTSVAVRLSQGTQLCPNVVFGSSDRRIPEMYKPGRGVTILQGGGCTRAALFHVRVSCSTHMPLKVAIALRLRMLIQGPRASTKEMPREG